MSIDSREILAERPCSYNNAGWGDNGRSRPQATSHRGHMRMEFREFKTMFSQGFICLCSPDSFMLIN